MADLSRRTGLRRIEPRDLTRRSPEEIQRRRYAASQRTALLAAGKVFGMRVDRRAADLQRRFWTAQALSWPISSYPTPTPEDIQDLADNPPTPEDDTYLRENPPASLKMVDTLTRFQRFRRDLRVRWIEWWELGSAGPIFRRYRRLALAPVWRIYYAARWPWWRVRSRWLYSSAPGRLLWRIRRFFS